MADLLLQIVPVFPFALAERAHVPAESTTSPSNTCTLKLTSPCSRCTKMVSLPRPPPPARRVDIQLIPPGSPYYWLSTVPVYCQPHQYADTSPASVPSHPGPPHADQLHRPHQQSTSTVHGWTFYPVRFHGDALCWFEYTCVSHWTVASRDFRRSSLDGGVGAAGGYSGQR
jgi:hypothetical protein